MKFLPAALAALVLCLLPGCRAMTLEEARAECKKQGGFLVEIHTQKLTRAGVGDEITRPGDCVTAEQLDVTPAKPAAAPAPAN